MNSAVYVAALVLQPRLHTNHLPKSGEFRGILPLGKDECSTSREVTFAEPLMEVRGLMSHEGVM